jgi:hypothetical protein
MAWFVFVHHGHIVHLQVVGGECVWYGKPTSCRHFTFMKVCAAIFTILDLASTVIVFVHPRCLGKARQSHRSLSLQPFPVVRMPTCSYLHPASHGSGPMQGTQPGVAASAAYNDKIASHTARHAMLVPLQKPLAQPHGVFRDVLRLHWREKALHIRQWMRQREVRRQTRDDVHPSIAKLCVSYMAELPFAAIRVLKHAALWHNFGDTIVLQNQSTAPVHFGGSI